jgi:hypothetical protein
MALEKNTSYKDINVSGAYYKVCRFSGEKTSLTFTVEARSSNESDSFEIKNYDCAYNIGGDNPIKQAYLHLKTLPEFADATDV